VRQCVSETHSSNKLSVYSRCGRMSPIARVQGGGGGPLCQWRRLRGREKKALRGKRVTAPLTRRRGGVGKKIRHRRCVMITSSSATSRFLKIPTGEEIALTPRLYLSSTYSNCP